MQGFRKGVAPKLLPRAAVGCAESPAIVSEEDQAARRSKSAGPCFPRAILWKLPDDFPCLDVECPQYLLRLLVGRAPAASASVAPACAPLGRRRFRINVATLQRVDIEQTSRWIVRCREKVGRALDRWTG